MRGIYTAMCIYLFYMVCTHTYITMNTPHMDIHMRYVVKYISMFKTTVTTPSMSEATARIVAAHIHSMGREALVVKAK